MPGFLFYFFVGFITSVMFEHDNQPGALVVGVILLGNLAFLGIWAYAIRDARRRGPLWNEGKLLNFLVMAPVLYVIGLSGGGWLQVYY